MDVATLYTIYNDNVTNIKGLGLFFLGLFVMSGFMQVMVINTLIFGFLAYKTMSWLTQPVPTDQSEAVTAQTVLLKQWVVMSSLVVLEYFIGSFFGTLYIVLKLGAFVVLLQNSPQLLTIYDSVLSTLFVKYQDQLDQGFKYLEEKANTIKSRDLNVERKNYDVMNMLRERFPFLDQLLSARKVKKTE